MSQQLFKKYSNKKINAINKLKKVLEQCSYLKTEINSIKNLTFKAKRNLDVSIKQVKDKLKKATIVNSTKRTANEEFIDMQNKENNSNQTNQCSSLKRIEVMLPIQKKHIMWPQCQQKLGEKIMLELQEIRLIEQRENLICKKNQRLNNYYSETKKQLDTRKSQNLQKIR